MFVLKAKNVAKGKDGNGVQDVAKGKNVGKGKGARVVPDANGPYGKGKYINQSHGKGWVKWSPGRANFKGSFYSGKCYAKGSLEFEFMGKGQRKDGHWAFYADSDEESEPPSCTGDQPEESVLVESSEPEPEVPERFPDEQPTLDRLS